MMWAEDKEFKALVGRLKIDHEPECRHRDKVRWQMLLRFNTNRWWAFEPETGMGRSRRTIMKGVMLKTLVAAIIGIGVVLGLVQLRRGAAEVEELELAAPVASSTPAGESDGNMVRIEFELPRAMFQGTEKDIRVANLRKIAKERRAPFFAPAGTKNVALGKGVSGSDEEPVIGDLGMITDGDKEAADGSYVELGPLLQHVTIDLEGEHEIYGILVWHYHKNPVVYFDVVVQVAGDVDFTENVSTLFNNDIDNSAGLGVGEDMHYVETYEGNLIDGRGVRGRYVRLYSNGSTTDDLNHYVEVEVYGRAVR